MGLLSLVLSIVGHVSLQAQCEIVVSNTTINLNLDPVSGDATITRNRVSSAISVGAGCARVFISTVDPDASGFDPATHILEFPFSNPDFDCDDVGNTTGSYWLFFGNANNYNNATSFSEDVEITLNIIDSTLPTVTNCNDVGPVNSDAGNDAVAGDCTAELDITKPDITENCLDNSVLTVSYDVPAGAPAKSTEQYGNGFTTSISDYLAANGGVITDDFYVGTTTITFTINDGSTGDVSCEIEVEVVDNEAPTLVCPADVSKNVTTGQCYWEATGADIVPTTQSDNCSATLEFSLDGGSRQSGTVDGVQFPIGTTTVTYYLSDGVNAEQSCSFDVTVTDDEGPSSFTCSAPSPIALDGAGMATLDIGDMTLSASDCSTISYSFSNPAGTNSISFDCSHIGVQMRTVYAFDADGNVSSCSFSTTIEDDMDPSISLPDPADASASLNTAGDCYASYDWTRPGDADVSDNCTAAANITITEIVTSYTGPEPTAATIAAIQAELGT
ncbi:MAG: HYR domain-containing protein, partial [Bacteroidota bacterium]